MHLQQFSCVLRNLPCKVPETHEVLSDVDCATHSIHQHTPHWLYRTANKHGNKWCRVRVLQYIKCQWGGVLFGIRRVWGWSECVSWQFLISLTPQQGTDSAGCRPSVNWRCRGWGTGQARQHWMVSLHLFVSFLYILITDIPTAVQNQRAGKCFVFVS